MWVGGEVCVMAINAGAIIERLDRFVSVLPAVVSGLKPDDALWQPNSETWSITEIICHLADEEARDFRPRIQSTLANPNQAWEPVDPEGWAIARNYREADLEEVTSRFVAERHRTIMWLWSLAAPDWTKVHNHPKHDPISAGDLLTSWAAHDALHLRQIAKRLFELAQRDGDGFMTAYAGQW